MTTTVIVQWINCKYSGQSIPIYVNQFDVNVSVCLCGCVTSVLRTANDAHILIFIYSSWHGLLFYYLDNDEINMMWIEISIMCMVHYGLFNCCIFIMKAKWYLCCIELHNGVYINSKVYI
jgi:hypothetical protein